MTATLWILTVLGVIVAITAVYELIQISKRREKTEADFDDAADAATKGGWCLLMGCSFPLGLALLGVTVCYCLK